MRDPVRNIRNLKLAKLHALKRDAGLDDDAYRDKLAQLTGKRSAKDLSDAELDGVLAMFHGKHSAAHPFSAKIKALWIAAYNLGAVGNGNDAALEAFAKRQTGKERLAFLTPAEANAVTEALKAICAREGFIVPKADDAGMAARKALLLAQWAKLTRLRQTMVAGEDGLDGWISHRVVPRRDSHTNLKRHELDQAAILLGRWIRRVRARPA